MSQIVDWDLAATTAARLSKSGPSVTYAEAAEVVSELRRHTADAEAHVREFTGLTGAVDHPPVLIVDRGDWAAVNISGMRNVIDPVAEKLDSGRTNAALRAVGAKVAGAQAGGVLAYMSGKVLGQFEVFSGDPGQLMIVAPNIVEVERKLGANPRDFRLWVCLHEVTHRTQFGVSWMRDHFLSEVGEFTDSANLDPDALAERVRRAITTVSESIRESGQDQQGRSSLLDVVQTPAQRAVLGRLTALMTLLEGHAEFVMDEVGPAVVPSVAQIRSAFNARRVNANPLEKLIRRLLGVDAKMRQYAEGRKFVSAVVAEVGMTGFNKIWSSPATLPTMDEIAEPSTWIARVIRGEATDSVGDQSAEGEAAADDTAPAGD
jgi:coenzyme F420 biosynthesis associated uncharacterized protein